MMAPPGVVPPVAPLSSLLMQQYGTIPLVIPLVIAPQIAAPPPAAPMPCSFEPLKHCALKDAKVFVDNYDLIQYYLRIPDILIGWADDALVTDSLNLDASRMWEGQLCLVVKDGLLHYLFKNKGALYNGRGFEMLAALNQHCHPNSMANAFTSLLTLFNDIQGTEEPIFQYHSQFDGIVMELSHCKVAIPQILMVMLFLCAIYSRYLDLLEQFCTRFKLIKMARWLPSIQLSKISHITMALRSMNAKVEPNLQHLLLGCQLLLAPTRITKVRSGIRLLNGFPNSANRQSRLSGLALLQGLASA